MQSKKIDKNILFIVFYVIINEISGGVNRKRKSVEVVKSLI